MIRVPEISFAKSQQATRPGSISPCAARAISLASRTRSNNIGRSMRPLNVTRRPSASDAPIRTSGPAANVCPSPRNVATVARPLGWPRRSGCCPTVIVDAVASHVIHTRAHPPSAKGTPVDILTRAPSLPAIDAHALPSLATASPNPPPILENVVRMGRSSPAMRVGQIVAMTVNDPSPSRATPRLARA